MSDISKPWLTDQIRSALFVNNTFHQCSSVAQSCLTLCDPMDCSTPGFPVHHQLPEPAQTDVHGVGDAIQPSHPLSSPSSPAFNLSQHQGPFSIIPYWKVFTPICLCIFGCFYTTIVVVTKTVKLTKIKIFTDQENSVYGSTRKILENRKEMVGNELKEVEEKCEEYCVHMTTVHITL